MKLKWIYVYSVYLTIAWILFILVLCATPGRYIPSAGWMQLLSIDKLVHAFIFFVLVILMFISIMKNHGRKFMLFCAVLIAISYGIWLEYMQAHYFSERASDVFDMIANAFGSIMGLCLTGRVRHFVSRQGGAI